MGKLAEWTGSVKGFFSDVSEEARKTSWPERSELYESTLVVIASVVLLSLFTGVSDKVLITVLRLLVRYG